MSSARTGYALGTLSPTIFFERKDGYVIMPPAEIGNPALTRQIYEQVYRKKGWEWREVSTLHDVDKLQAKLEHQEMVRIGHMLDVHDRCREHVRSAVAENLRRRMVSAATSEWEREFIAHYIKLREEPKRDRYRQALMHRNYYLWAREQDSGTNFWDKLVMPVVTESGVK